MPIFKKLEKGKEYFYCTCGRCGAQIFPDSLFLHVVSGVMVVARQRISLNFVISSRSKNQPFCDGSHNGTSFQPLKYTAEKSGTVKFCS